MNNPKLILLTSNPPLEFNLSVIPCSIGRDEGNNIILDHQSVSRQHCVIIKDNDKFTILDKQSKNGIYVNGNQVKETVLQDGDLIKIGRYQFTFKTEPESQQVEKEKCLQSFTELDDKKYPVKIEKVSQQGQKSQVDIFVSIIRSLIICCIITGGLGFIVCYALIKGWIKLRNFTEKDVWTSVIVVGCLTTLAHIIWLTISYRKSRSSR